MKAAVTRLIRYGAYPIVFGGTATTVLWLSTNALVAWPAFALVAIAGIGLVALLERLQPYERAWMVDHADTATDAIHLLVNLGLLWLTAYMVHAVRAFWSPGDFWPSSSPFGAQVLLAGAVIDFGLYAMHRASHRNEWLWRLHAIHHSAERLYWMNGERRHPLSAVAMAGPGIVAVVALGASPLVISAWLTLLSVHLAFQHANVDYRVGPLRHVLGVAEVHRWHHKREYEDAQVNFGEFWMIWDHLFGTFHDRPEAVRAGDVGLRERAIPAAYVAQLRWPFRTRVLRRETAFSAVVQPIEEKPS